MTTIVLTLNQEELQIFEALMKLKRRAAGGMITSRSPFIYFYEPMLSKDWLADPNRRQVIRLHDYTEGRKIITELQAHNLPMNVKTQ